MIARIVTYGGAQWGLLAAQPNWDTEIKVSMELPTDVAKEPITFTESRRNFAQSARYSMEWTSYFSNVAEATELRLFLNRVREVPILVPLWPDACELSAAIPAGRTTFTLVDLPARLGSFWIIANDDFSLWDIVTGGINLATKVMTLQIGPSNPYPAGTRIYPLIQGRLEERPQAEAITDEAMELSFKIKEASNFVARITPVTTLLESVGPTIPEFATALKWQVTPNHSRPLDWTEMPDIIYEQVGFLRYEQRRVYDHATARGQELEFYQSDRASIAKIEYFWRACRATTLRFMIPTYRGDLRMLNDTPIAGHPTWIECELNYFSSISRAAQLGDPYIAVINVNDVVTPYKVQIFDDSSHNKTRLVATSVTTVHAFQHQNCIISHLLLARFAEPKLEWTYTTPYMATTRIKFQEVPDEYPSNINQQTPPPALPEPAYLFIFKEEGIRTDRFTSYENTLILNTGTYRGTYVPAPFSFDTVKVGLKLDQEKLDLKSWKFEGNPLNKMWPFALDAILTLEIVEVNVRPFDPTQPPTNPVSRFYGDVWSVDSDYKAVVIPFGNLFDRKFPRFLLSVSDNYTQFSVPTKLTPSAFKITGTINGTVNNLSQTLVVNSAVAHAKATNYFAGGWLETGVGLNKEKRGILYSTPSLSAGTVLCDSYSQSNQSASGTLYTPVASAVAQSFTGNGSPLNYAMFWLKKVGAPPGTMAAKLYAHSGTFGTSSVPGSLIATSNAVQTTVLATNYTLVQFNFSTAPVLTNGTKYCIAISYVGGDISNQVQVGYDNTTSTHPGNYSHFTTVWAAFGFDVCFYVYTTGNIDAVTLTIDRPLLKAATNQALDLYPGYDGSIDQCETKFFNRINFGGHAFIPNVNPGVKAIKPKDTKGGKKG